MFRWSSRLLTATGRVTRTGRGGLGAPFAPPCRAARDTCPPCSWSGTCSHGPYRGAHDRAIATGAGRSSPFARGPHGLVASGRCPCDPAAAASASCGGADGGRGVRATTCRATASSRRPGAGGGRACPRWPTVSANAIPYPPHCGSSWSSCTTSRPL